MPYTNKDDQAKAGKEHYQKYRSAYLERNKLRKVRNREFLQEYKTDKPCTDCGVVYPWWITDFDHLFDKKYTIARMQTHSLETLQKEIDKCELVCANCHRERTHKRRIGKDHTL